MKCNVENCNGADHRGLCWICPHSDDVKRGVFAEQSWETTPCFCCATEDCDSREQGHGRVISYEEAPPLLVAAFPNEENEEKARDEYIAAAAEILRKLMQLTPKEYVTLIESMRFCAEDDSTLVRTLNHVKRITNSLFKEDVSFQIVGYRLKSAKKKLRAMSAG